MYEFYYPFLSVYFSLKLVHIFILLKYYSVSTEITLGHKFQLFFLQKHECTNVKAKYLHTSKPKYTSVNRNPNT